MNFSGFDFDGSVKEALSALDNHGRIPHAIIIESKNKESALEAAKFLSMYAVCTGDNKPCKTCEQCRKAEIKCHADISYPRPENKSKTYSIEQMRNIIKDSYIRPNEANAKVYVFEEADNRLTDIAQNSFLKLLEEPPQASLFLLLCKNSRGLLNTILSRCTVLTVKGDEDYSPESLELARAVALGTVAPSEWELLSALSAFSDRRLADETLAVLTVIFRDCIACARGIAARIDAELAQKLSKRITTGMALQLAQATELARQKIPQNINMDLLSAFLSGEYRRIIWQR